METIVKCFNAKDFASLYYNKERIIVFLWQIRLSNTRHEYYVILKSCFEEKRVNMVALDSSPIHYFYFHLSIINDLGVLILVTLYKVKFPADVNVASSQFTPYVWSMIEVFKLNVDDWESSLPLEYSSLYMVSMVIGQNCALMVTGGVTGISCFPLSWKVNLKIIMGFDIDYVSLFDQELVQILNDFEVMSSRAMITLDQRDDSRINKYSCNLIVKKTLV